MTFKMEHASDYEFIKGLADRIDTEGIDTEALVASGEVPLFEKYDTFIPDSLLRRQYAADRLRTDEVAERIKDILNEY